MLTTAGAAALTTGAKDSATCSCEVGTAVCARVSGPVNDTSAIRASVPESRIMDNPPQPEAKDMRRPGPMHKRHRCGTHRTGDHGFAR